MVGGTEKPKIPSKFAQRLAQYNQGSHSPEKALNFRKRPWKFLELYFSLRSPYISVQVFEKSLNFLQLWL